MRSAAVISTPLAVFLQEIIFLQETKDQKDHNCLLFIYFFLSVTDNPPKPFSLTTNSCYIVPNVQNKLKLN